MKKKFNFITASILIIMLSVFCLSISANATTLTPFEDLASWDFIQASGGIKIGKPEMRLNKYNKKSIYLPIKCNISGFRSTTHKPTVVNSKISIYGIAVNFTKNQIFISISTGHISKEMNQTECDGIFLNGFSPGKYEIFYFDEQDYGKQSHFLDSITISY